MEQRSEWKYEFRGGETDTKKIKGIRMYLELQGEPTTEQKIFRRAIQGAIEEAQTSLDGAVSGEETFTMAYMSKEKPEAATFVFHFEYDHQ